MKSNNNDVLEFNKKKDAVIDVKDKGIKEVVIPNGITKIGDYAFVDCRNLESVEIPRSIKVIGIEAFYRCNNLRFIFYNGTIESWCNIKIDGDYSSCEDNWNTSIIDFYILGSDGKYMSVKELTIPSIIPYISNYQFMNFVNLINVVINDGASSIGYEAFNECSNLCSIVIPKSMKYICDSAFLGCRNLKKIYYKGNKIDWLKITIEDGDECFYGATIYYYSEEEPTDEGNYWHYVSDEIVIW